MARISNRPGREAHNADLHELARALRVHLKRVGAGEYAGPCPPCGGRDRFAINTKKQHFELSRVRHQGQERDRSRLAIENGGFADAVQKLTGGAWTPSAPKRPIPTAAPAVSANGHLGAATGDLARSRPDRWLARPNLSRGRGIDLTDVPDHGGLRFHRALPVGDRDRALHRRPLQRRAQRRAARDLALADQRREAEELRADRRLCRPPVA